MKILKAFLLLLIISACKNEPKEAPTEEVTLAFETTTITKKSGEGCLNDEFDCTLISLEIPIAKGPEDIVDRINATVKEHVISLYYTDNKPDLPSYEDFAKFFISEQQKVKERFHEAAPWRAVVMGRVYSETEHLLCIGMDSETFTGGAHGYRSIRFLNFNPKTGTLYEHMDIFTEDFVDFAEKAFREKKGIPEEDNINSTGLWFEDDRYKLPNNIGFEEDKVILVYSAYEIASYADGEFHLEFTKEEVAPYLKLLRE